MNRYPLSEYPIDCARCICPAPIHVDELTGDGPGPSGAAMPMVMPVPEGWAPSLDPEDGDDAIVCSDCATAEEWEAWTEGLAHAHSALLGES